MMVTDDESRMVVATAPVRTHQRVGRKAAEELARPFAGERLDPARQLQHAKQKQDQTADDFERNG